MRINTTGDLGLKPLGGSKVDSAFHPSEVDRMSTGTPRDVVVKSKLSRSGTVALRQLKSIYKKGVIKLFLKLDLTQVSTAQNGQIRNCLRVFDHFAGLALKGLISVCFVVYLLHLVSLVIYEIYI